MKRFIEVDLKQAGQPRPYADSIYEGYLTFSVPEGQMYASKWPKDPEQVKPFAQLLIEPWYDEPQWYQSRLKTLERVPGETNRWHVIVIRPYLD
jgi:hypothetical protein